MNNQELMQMISDHYLGEAQLLTSGAEENLLKLAELRGNQTEQERQRWAEILQAFLKNRSLGGDDADSGAKVVSQLYDLGKSMETIATLLDQRLSPVADISEKEGRESVVAEIGRVREALQNVDYNIEVVNQPVPGLSKILSVIADTFEHSIYPLVHSMEGKLKIDLKTQQNMVDIFSEIRTLRDDLKSIEQVKTKRYAPKRKKPSGEDNE